MKNATIRARSEDVTEILLFDEIGADSFFGGISAKTFAEQLKDVKAKVINLRINSPGGSVFDGMAMLESLNRHKARVEVDIEGVAASAASVVAMAGDEIRIAESAFLMIHEASGGAIGTAEDMRHMAETLAKVSGQMVAVYEKRSGQKAKQIAEWMAAETWFTVEAGFADRLTESRRVAAVANWQKFAARYKHAPDVSALDAAAWEETNRRRELLEKMGV
jgi:ATP-dependent Clp protease protease subunit